MVSKRFLKVAKSFEQARVNHYFGGHQKYNGNKTVYRPLLKSI